MTSKCSLVDERFPESFNCAQTVFSLYAEELGLDERTALRIASGFAGGMACAETCGAATGSYMVIGLKHGYHISDANAKAQTKEKILLFNEKFKAAHGSLLCKELTGYNIATPEGHAAATKEDVFHRLCPQYIKTACEILENDF